MNDIIEAFRHKYKQCNVYSDKGTIIRQGVEQSTRQPTTFRTVFQRQKDFSFEWLDPTKGAFKLWREAELVSITTPRTGLRRSSDLMSALGEIAGISQGASSLVPLFLTSNDSLLDRIDWNVSENAAGPDVFYNFVGSLKEEDDSKLCITEQYTVYKVELLTVLSVEQQEALLHDAARIAASHGQTITLPELRNMRSTTQYCFEEVQIT